MKKFYLLLSMLALASAVSAQTLLIEDFSEGTMPPAGWTIDGHSGNWSSNTSSNAGGEAPEAKMNWSPQFNGTSRFVSPATDLTGETSVYLSFKHMLDDYSGSGYTLGVATTSGASGTWTDVWTVSPTGNIEGDELTLEIDNSDVGQPDFQFCIYFSGNSYNLDAWFIDDITLFLPYNLDASLSSIITPTFIEGAVPVEGYIKNMGMQQINSIELAWYIEGGEIFTTSIDGLSVDFGENEMFTCDQLFDYPIGGYTLTVEVVTVNGTSDDNPENDTKTKNISVVSHTVAYRPVFEEFTSSTCVPCASFNAQFTPWVQSNNEDLTLVKYQMDWPGSGDPYYTEEAGNRRNYYGVSYVPWLNMDGFLIASNVSTIDAAFQEALLRPGFLSIAAAHSLDGSEITVTANVVPFADFTDFRIHIVVFEYLTTGNVSSNGETEFHHVMMKMLPGADGTAVDMTDRMPVSITESFDMSSTFVEELSDLGVAIIVQDHAGYTVYQSAYSLEDAAYNTEDRLQDLTLDGTTIEGFDPDVLEYHIELEPGSPMPAVEGVAMDENAMVIIEPANEVPGMAHVDVFAEDHSSHKRYTIYYDGFVGFEDRQENIISAWPNPTTGIVKMDAAEGSVIEIFSTSGRMVKRVESFSGNSLDLGALRNGLYFLKVVNESGEVFSGKITVLK